MAQSGITKSWKGPFGLVEMEDGTVVRIDTEQIDGGRLRIGYPVKFDTEEVKGKQKGINVSGEAVLAKGATLTEEQLEADKKKIEELRAKDRAELEPVWAEVEKLTRYNRVQLMQKLSKKLGNMEVTLNKDKRMDGGKQFTKGEFLAFYGPEEGLARWNKAKKGKAGKKRSRKPKGEKKEDDAKEGEEEKKEEKKETPADKE